MEHSEQAEAWAFDLKAAFLHMFTSSFGTLTMFNIDIQHVMSPLKSDKFRQVTSPEYLCLGSATKNAYIKLELQTECVKSVAIYY